jgi:hypothetical protein
MLDEAIYRVLAKHDDFTYDEVKEICEDFLLGITDKIKDETKMKRLNKYLDKEFELDDDFEIETESNKVYNLETIPKYLFS